MQHILLTLALALLPTAPAQDPAPQPPPADRAEGQAEADAASAEGAVEGEQASPTILPLAPSEAGRAYEPDGPSTVITFADLDPVLLDRHAARPEGQDVLTRLLNGAILRALAAEQGVVIPQKTVDARIAEIDQKLKSQGFAGGIAEQLVENDVDPVIFRDSMELSLMQEELTRLSLGLPEGERPGVGPQNAWMEAALAARTTELRNDPFPTAPSDAVAISDDVVVTLAAFQEHLRDELPRPFVEQAITQLVLQKRLQAQAGAIEPAVWEAAVQAELDRRRERHEANPETMGVPYEQLLDAQGLSVETLRRDPAVVVTALTSVLSWRQSEAAAAAAGVERPDAGGNLEAYRDAGRRELYLAEQELFDGFFGEQLFLTSCVLQTKDVPDETVARSTQDGLDYLTRLGAGIPDREGFELIVEKISDDAQAAQTKGRLGWVGRAGGNMPAEIVELAFEHWDEHGEPGVAGPIEIPGGVALFWVGPHEPAPEWDELSPAIQAELQARILNEALPEGGIHIFRDPPPQAGPAGTPIEDPAEAE